MNAVARLSAVLGLAVLAAGCASPRPSSFTHTMVPGWVSFEVREGVSYDRAWETVFQILSRDFDIPVSSKESGYLQTGWLHTWAGSYQETYRVRVTAKFSADRQTLQVKSEAWVFDGKSWLIGSDSRLTATLKTDLMGTIGRTTR